MLQYFTTSTYMVITVSWFYLLKMSLGILS